MDSIANEIEREGGVADINVVPYTINTPDMSSQDFVLVVNNLQENRFSKSGYTSWRNAQQNGKLELNKRVWKFFTDKQCLIST